MKEASDTEAEAWRKEAEEVEEEVDDEAEEEHLDEFGETRGRW